MDKKTKLFVFNSKTQMEMKGKSIILAIKIYLKTIIKTEYLFIA